MKPRVIVSLTALLVVAIVALAGCGLPRDPDGTLDRVTGGELRVGASPSEGLVATADDEVAGPLPEIVRGFAETRDARVVWVVGSEEDLVEGLEAGSLDLAIGGFTDQTPWVERVGVSRAFADLVDGEHPVVMLVPLGENGLLSALEGYLDGRVSP